MYHHFKAHIIRQEYLGNHHNLEDREKHRTLLTVLRIICYKNLECHKLIEKYSMSEMFSNCKYYNAH